MKKFSVCFFLLIALSWVVTALADGTKNQIIIISSTDGHVKPLEGTPAFETVVAGEFTTTNDFEKLVVETQKLLNQLSPKAAELAVKSYNTIMKGDPSNLQRLPDVATNVMENLLAVIERYSQNSPILGEKSKEIRARLEKLYGYNFGPERPDSVSILKVSKEGKGVIIVEGREILYTITPGLYDTIQNEREVIAVEKLLDGMYKVAIGIFYPGQETVSLTWDERTFPSIQAFLEYHNASPAQIEWLKCGKSSCVPSIKKKPITKKK